MTLSKVFYGLVFILIASVLAVLFEVARVRYVLAARQKPARSIVDADGEWHVLYPILGMWIAAISICLLGLAVFSVPFYFTYQDISADEFIWVAIGCGLMFVGTVVPIYQTYYPRVAYNDQSIVYRHNWFTEPVIIAWDDVIKAKFDKKQRCILQTVSDNTYRFHPYREGMNDFTLFLAKHLDKKNAS